MVTIFNDKNPRHIERLEREIENLPGINELKFYPDISCLEVGNEIVQRLEKARLIPCLTFIDPCGYKGLTAGLIGSITKDWGCDCIVFFNTNRIKMALNNPVVEPLIDDLFGKEIADELRESYFSLPEDERESQIIESLYRALSAEGAEYILPFKFMAAHRRRTSHHLIFITKNFTAYKIMKEIMYAESSEVAEGVASFEYCQATGMQPHLLAYLSPIEALKESLFEDFKGETLTLEEVFMKHSIGKPYVLKNYQDVLKELEQEGRILADPPADKRHVRKGKLTFPKHVLITFIG